MFGTSLVGPIAQALTSADAFVSGSKNLIPVVSVLVSEGPALLSTGAATMLVLAVAPDRYEPWSWRIFALSLCAALGFDAYSGCLFFTEFSVPWVGYLLSISAVSLSMGRTLSAWAVGAPTATGVLYAAGCVLAWAVLRSDLGVAGCPAAVLPEFLAPKYGDAAGVTATLLTWGSAVRGFHSCAARLFILAPFSLSFGPLCSFSSHLPTWAKPLKS